MKKILFCLSLGFIGLVNLLPLTVLAENGAVDLPSSNIQIQFQNPLKSPDLDSLIRDVVNIITYILVPLMALFIMYVGFQYVTAQGNKGKLMNTHENLKWVLIGSAIILGTGTILAVIQNTITAIKN